LYGAGIYEVLTNLRPAFVQLNLITTVIRCECWTSSTTKCDQNYILRLITTIWVTPRAGA